MIIMIIIFIYTREIRHVRYYINLNARRAARTLGSVSHLLHVRYYYQSPVSLPYDMQRPYQMCRKCRIYI